MSAEDFMEEFGDISKTAAIDSTSVLLRHGMVVYTAMFWWTIHANEERWRGMAYFVRVWSYLHELEHISRESIGRRCSHPNAPRHPDTVEFETAVFNNMVTLWKASATFRSRVSIGHMIELGKLNHVPPSAISVAAALARRR